ncbi:MAG TPA: pirin-like C-terminal cupin domain-containing protein [Flavisolibacter sp.]|nr:pirin-like C-terminal cupin domain-containing protein [Flavisolibacter sp.]
MGGLYLNVDHADSELHLTAGDESVRFVLYAGKPTGEHIVSYGPSIAESSEDIKRLYQEYRLGKMKHILTAPAEQKI